MSKLLVQKAYRIIGWCMVAYAVVDIVLAAMNIRQTNGMDIAAKVQSLVTGSIIAVTVVEVALYGLAAFAGITLNLKLGLISLIALASLGVICFVTLLFSGHYCHNDLRIIVMPLVYFCFLYPARKESGV